MTRKYIGALLAMTIMAYAGCASFPYTDSSATLAEQMVRDVYPLDNSPLNRRAVQDDAQKACSSNGAAAIAQDKATAIIQSARASMRYPTSGRLSGDWKNGARLVSDGRGQRIVNGKVEVRKQNGALCINCHAMDPTDVNAGTLGPSLIGYGRNRGSDEATVRYTYERIYNAWAFVPCSNMPRLGANGFLTPEQIADVVAYLVQSQSPVNGLR